jgi:hypothetical protein
MAKTEAFEFIKSFRKYCKKCGLTWYTKNEKEPCPDCLSEKTWIRPQYPPKVKVSDCSQEEEIDRPGRYIDDERWGE